MWGPAGSQQPGGVSESGLNLNQAIVQPINAGETKETSFVTVIPHALRHNVLELRYVPQSRLFPPILHVTVAAEGWRVQGIPNVSEPWTKTTILTWTFSR